MPNKIIIFDMDGVIFDSNTLAKKSMKDRFPGLTEKMLQEVLTGNFHEEIEKLTIPRKVETEQEKLARQLQYGKDKAQVGMYDGMGELLLHIKEKGFILVLNTSAFDRYCLPMLENSNIKHLFDFLGTAEISKSKVEKFKIVKEKYQAGENDMLFITDTLGDIREADLADIPTVAVTWGAHDESYFTREEHKNLIKILNKVEELKDFILNY